MDETKNSDLKDQTAGNEDERSLSDEELDLLAFILNQPERPLHSGL